MATKNVYVIGAQSTGKSTIVNALQRVLLDTSIDNFGIRGRDQQLQVIQEVARGVLVKHGFSRDDITLRPSRAFELQKHILRAQFEAETKVSSFDEHTRYISDRSGLDPIVYSQVFVGSEAAEELLSTPEWAFLEVRMRNGIVALCEAGTDWLRDDGVRLMPKDRDDWMRIDKAFRRLLEARGIDFLVVPRDMHALDDRVFLVKEALEGAASPLRQDLNPNSAGQPRD